MIDRARVLLALCTAGCVSWPSAASAAPLRIRSATALSGSTTLTPDDQLILRGALRDDLGAPVGGQRVELSLDATPASVEPCSVQDDVGSEGRSLYARTDQDGSFCVSVYGILPRGVAHVRYPGSDFHLPAVGEIALRPAQGSVTLRFDAGELVANLDKPSWLVPISVLASGSGAPPSVRISLLLQVTEGPARPLATLDARANERVEVDVDTRTLGEPGTARLIARHAGSPSVPRSEAVATLRKTAHVRLEPVQPVRAARANEPTPLRVEAQSSIGPVHSGWVEARSGDQVIGTAPVVDGVAQVVVRVGATRADSISVALSYLPRDDGWLPGPPVPVTIAVVPPSPWTRLPWMVAALAVAYWVVRTWKRPARSAKREPSARSQPDGRADVVLHARPGPASGWSGSVVDAHTGAPIEGARLEISTPTFSGSGILDAKTTGSDGSFSFEPPEAVLPDGSELRVTARWHGELAKQLPPEGHLTVSLVSRRRVLLARLVAWAERRGGPWAGAGDPTPGAVAAVAHRHGDQGVAAWAKIVEEAAFGPEAPDETVETNVRAREPGAVHTPRRER